MSTGGRKRQQWQAVRCYLARNSGMTLGEIAEREGLSREVVQARITLGYRLRSLPEFNRPIADNAKLDGNAKTVE